jgi:uncharacterized protein YjbI with pentapeptide repeats
MVSFSVQEFLEEGGVGAWNTFRRRNAGRLDISGTVFDRQFLENADFSSCDVSGAEFADCSLRGADLRLSDLLNTTFLKCNLTNADLSAANLHDAHFSNCDVSNADFSDSTGMRIDQFEKCVGL